MYKKLFQIKYHDKNFMIFMDQTKRKTFLEINAKNEYVYPTLEDFLALNKIYNTKDNKLYNIKDFIYKEKVRIASGLLTVLVSFNALPHAMAANVDKENATITLEAVQEPNYHYIKDSNDLDVLLGYKSVSKDQVLEAINANSNLDSLIKRALIDILDLVTSYDANADLRIFYENVKTLKVNSYTYEEFRKKYGGAGGGVYFPSTNSIDYIKGASEDLIYHELWHATTMFSRQINNDIYSNETENVAFDEALDNYYIKDLKFVTNSYKLSVDTLEFLLKYTDYSYTDYNHGGADLLVQKLKANYPQVDIDYISETLNAFNNTLVHLNQNEININEFYDEVFKIALLNIDINSEDIYKPYKDFINILSSDSKSTEAMFKYLNKYNYILFFLNYHKIKTPQYFINRYKNYEDVIALGYNQEGKLFPIIDYTYNENSELKVKNENHEITTAKLNGYHGYSNFYSLGIKETIINEDIVGTQEFWQAFAKDNKTLPAYMYNKIPIYYNGKEIANDYLSNFTLNFTYDLEGNIGFQVINNKGETLINTNPNYTMSKGGIFLTDYADTYNSSLNYLNLNDLLNEDYLKNVIYDNKAGTNTNFLDMLVIDNKIIFESKCQIKIEDATYPIEEFNATYIQDNLKLPFINILIPATGEGTISLEEVLRYHNIFDEHKKEYTFTKIEIIDLYENYLKNNKSISR